MSASGAGVEALSALVLKLGQLSPRPKFVVAMGNITAARPGEQGYDVRVWLCVATLRREHAFIRLLCMSVCVCCLAQEDAATFKRILRMLPADVALVCTLAVHAEMTT